ncbi:MAG: hypothetical protein LBT46_02410, partial [Planctomycetaceae bacterium]|nr:hypothetical protein [Planctomycetaceae bacterium]
VVLRANPLTFQEIREKMKMTFDEAIEKCGLAAKWEARGREWGKAEGEALGEARGEARGKAEGISEGEERGKAEGQVLAILCVLKARFGSIPQALQDRLFAVTNLTQLETLAGQAAVCPSVDVFSKQV